MKKERLPKNKPVLIFLLLLIGAVFSTGSVLAARSTLEPGDLAPPVFSSYALVTVERPFTDHTAAAAPQQECILDTSGMISHWPLDEAVGSTTFADVAGGLDGTCDKNEDKCPVKTFGKVGSAFNFVASDKDVISVPADVPPGKTIYDSMANGDFTVGVWVKTTQVCITGEINNKVFIGRYRDLNDNGTWWLGCKEPGGVAVFRLRDSTDTFRQIDGTSKITDGQWHHIVGVRDAGADVNYLYVDGVLEATLDTPLYSPAGNFSSDMPITMGGYDEPTPYYLDGTLDEVVLYNRVMPPGEINGYYEACEAASAFNYIPLVIR